MTFASSKRCEAFFPLLPVVFLMVMAVIYFDSGRYLRSLNEGGKRNQDLPRGGVHVHDLPHSSRGPLKIGGIERSGDTQESHTTKGSNWKAKNHSIKTRMCP